MACCSRVALFFCLPGFFVGSYKIGPRIVIFSCFAFFVRPKVVFRLRYLFFDNYAIIIHFCTMLACFCRLWGFFSDFAPKLGQKRGFFVNFFWYSLFHFCLKKVKKLTFFTKNTTFLVQKTAMRYAKMQKSIKKIAIYYDFIKNNYFYFFIYRNLKNVIKSSFLGLFYVIL